MANKTFDLDDYISQRKEKDPEFAKDFDAGYDDKRNATRKRNDTGTVGRKT